MNRKARSPRKAKSGINLTDLLTLIVQEITRNAPSLAHIDISRIHISIASNRNGKRSTIYGKLVPLRFKDGNTHLIYRDKCYAMPEFVHNGIPLLYLIYFYTPSFLNLGALEKLRVIFHELYHINPSFNGDIRRMGNVKASHGHSKSRFDAQFEPDLLRFHEYIMETPYRNFLEMDAAALFATFGRIYSSRIKLPKPVLVDRPR